MGSRHLALLLLALLGLHAEPGTATLKKRIGGGTHPHERDGGVDEATSQTPAPPTNSPNGRCLLPLERGECQQRETRFSYNPASGHCEKFAYGGCGGNENNFQTAEECLRICSGTVAPNAGQCARTAPLLPRPSRSYCAEGLACPGDEKCCPVQNTRKCHLPVGARQGYCPREEQGERGGESVSPTPCSVDTDCARHEKCCPKHGHRRCTHAVPAHPGLCPKVRLPRVLVPCGGQCEDDRGCPAGKKCCFSVCGLKCVSPESHQSQRGEEPDQGEAHTHTLWREKASRDPWLPEAHGREPCRNDPECPHGERCCHGQCRQVCRAPADDGPLELHATVPDLCRLPWSVGSTCRAGTSGLRVAYNPRAGLCEKFVYQGCGGNQNNFATQLECLRTCSNPSICQLPVDRGFGDAFRTRFYYHGASKTCKEFLYAGHGGNANNFWEEGGCLRFCAGREA